MEENTMKKIIQSMGKSISHIIFVSEEQLNCLHDFRMHHRDKEYKCTKCFLSLWDYDKLREIKKEVEHDPGFIKLKQEAKNEKRTRL